MLYFDASALAKRYVHEPETASVRRLLDRGVPATSRSSEIEVASAVVRRSREGRLSAASRDRVLAQLRQDVAAMFVVEPSREVVDIACALLRRHPLRGADAIQLASCLHLAGQLEAATEFVVYDAVLAAAARAEGIEVLNPS